MSTTGNSDEIVSTMLLNAVGKMISWRSGRLPAYMAEWTVAIVGRARGSDT